MHGRDRACNDPAKTRVSRQGTKKRSLAASKACRNAQPAAGRGVQVAATNHSPQNASMAYPPIAETRDRRQGPYRGKEVAKRRRHPADPIEERGRAVAAARSS